MRVLLQPLGRAGSGSHFSESLANPLPFDSLETHFSPSERKKVKSMFPDGKLTFFGLRGGEGSPQESLWVSLSAGDIVLFCRLGEYVLQARVAYKVKSEVLAEAVWGHDKSGRTWENVYFVSDLMKISLPCESVNEAVGYKPGFSPQGAILLKQGQSDAAISSLSLTDDESNLPDVSKKEYEEAVERDFSGAMLDKDAKTTRRTEQSYLRKMLLNGKTFGKCGICGKILPVDLLVASHIKKRCSCSKEERLDIPNIAMPMCRLGCDSLYENGYILVEDGVIETNPTKKPTSDLASYLRGIDGVPCEKWGPETKEYFEFHNENAKIGK